MMLLGLLGKLGVVVTTITVSAVAGPMIAKQFSSNEITYDSGGKKCLHFSIREGDADNKLFICKKKEDNTPIFKWWVKGDTGDKMQKIKTLSWNKNSQGTDSVSDNFDYELEVTLEGEDVGPSRINEKGRGDHVIGVPIKNLEKNCTFGNTSNKQFVLLCGESDSGTSKKHKITVDSYE